MVSSHNISSLWHVHIELFSGVAALLEERIAEEKEEPMMPMGSAKTESVATVIKRVLDVLRNHCQGSRIRRP